MSQTRLLGHAGLVVLAAVALTDSLASSGLSAVVVCLGTGVGASLLAVSLWHGRPAPERRYACLGSVFCVYYAISYGFAILGEPPNFSSRLLPFGLDALDLSPLPLGIIAWYAGYRFLHASALSRSATKLLLPKTTTGPVGPATLLVFFGATVLTRVVLIGSGGGFGYTRDVERLTTSASSVLQYAAEFGNFGVVVLGLAIVASGHASHNRAGYRRAYRAMIVPELVLGLLVGSKETFLFVVVMIVLALSAAGRVHLSGRRAVAVGVVSLLVVFPLVSNYRDILRPDSGRQLPAYEAPAALITALRQTASTVVEGPGPYARLTFDSVAGRFREVDRAAVAIQTHDGGRPFSDPTDPAVRVASGIVPRVLWPDKPLNLYALEVSREYYGLNENVISASSLSPVGDAYRYGGLPMVAVLLALLGSLIRHLDEALAAKHSVWLVPLLIAAIPLLRGGDLAGLVVGNIRYFIIVGILYRFLFHRERNRSAGRGALVWRIKGAGSPASNDVPQEIR